MNKSVIPKDYLVDKYDNALLAKNKKKKGGGRDWKKICLNKYCGNNFV